MWGAITQVASGITPTGLAIGFAAIAACSAAMSAFLNWRSTRISTRIAQTQLYLKFRDQYSDKVMNDDLRNLRSWKELHGNKFSAKWKEKFIERDSDAIVVDAARRRVKNFFQAIAEIYQDGLISKSLAIRLLEFQGIDILYEIVEPLEEALNRDYNKSKFDLLKALKDGSGRDRPIGQIPRITKVD
jgi:hypothetical protein